MPRKVHISPAWKTVRLGMVLVFLLIFFHEYTTEEITEIVGVFGLDQHLQWFLGALGVGGGLETIRVIHNKNKFN